MLYEVITLGSRARHRSVENRNSKDFIRDFISNPEKEPDRIIREVLSGQSFAGQNTTEPGIIEQSFEEQA